MSVWPCNWPAIELFVAMETQWNTGFSGPLGIKYEVLRPVADTLGIPWSREMFNDIRTLEITALNTWAQRRKH